MSRVKITYVAVYSDGNKPITSASTFEDLKKSLDDYYGIGDKDKTAKYIGWFPYESKYPDEYEGYFEYGFTTEDETDKIKVYAIDYYPHTVYEVDENGYPLLEGTMNLCNDIISKISDEEIHKQSWKYNPVKKLDNEFIRSAFVNGCLWYREQIKNKLK